MMIPPRDKDDVHDVLIRDKAKAHTFLRKNYGKADKCESRVCDGKSKNFQWAKIHGKPYAENRDNFQMLCTKCHSNYDHRHKKNICRDCFKEYYNHDGSYIDALNYAIKLIFTIRHKLEYNGNIDTSYLIELLRNEVDCLKGTFPLLQDNNNKQLDKYIDKNKQAKEKIKRIASQLAKLEDFLT